MEKWNKLLGDNLYVDFVVNQNAYFLDLVSPPIRFIARDYRIPLYDALLRLLGTED